MKRIGRYTYRHLFGARLDYARRRNGILRPQGPYERNDIDLEPGELARRDIEIDRLILSSDDLCLADVVDMQHGGTHSFDVVAQLPFRQAVRSECIDVSEDVAEFVVETDTLQGIRESVR